MSLAVLLPVLLLLSLIPIWLLRSRHESGQDTLVSPGYLPPEAIRNASIAGSMRMAVFGPLFLLGATGEFWPVVIGGACSGAGIYLVYALRQRIFPFLEASLRGRRSVTVHAFIADTQSGDQRVRMVAARLTLVVLTAVVACEAFVLFEFFRLVVGNDTLARALGFGTLLLAFAYAAPAGHPGLIFSAQLQLGAIFLTLFAAASLLLYQHVSALTPLPGYVRIGIAAVALCCVATLIYRRSRYIETGAVDAASFIARLLSKFGKALNPIISVFVVLVIVLAGMDFFAASTPVPAFAPGSSGFPVLGLIALIILPLLYPLADAALWQKLAALENNRDAYQGDDARWLRSLRGAFRMQAIEMPLLWIFMASLGAISVAALAPTDAASIMQAFVQEVSSRENPFAVAAFALLLTAIVIIAVGAMAASFAAGLCTIHYDIMPAARGAVSTSMAGRIFFLAIVVMLIVLAENLPMSFTSSSFLALAFALCCPVLPFATLILGPAVTGRTVSADVTIAVLGTGAACPAACLAFFIATGSDMWLWAVAPACLGLSVLIFAAGAYGSRIR